MGEARLTLAGSLDVFGDNLPDIRRSCASNIQWLHTKYPNARPLKDDDPFTKENILHHIEHLKLKEATEHYERTIAYIDRRKKRTKPGQITDLHVIEAREYPIARLFMELTGQRPHRGMVQCPFHNDDSPSMSLRRHNRYHCFGCDAKGDTIDLVMRLEKKGFIDAVKTLCNTLL